MTSIDIYSILASKPHNPHYLKRYVKFVEICIRNNLILVENTVKHHICPKANDMFPEYSSFTKNEWNLAKLTRRQHMISHWMLWKIFNNISTMRSFYMLSHINGLQITSKMHHIISNEVTNNKIGTKHSKETISKMTGKIRSKEHSKNISDAKLGIPLKLTDEQRHNKRLAKLGMKDSELTIEKKRIAATGHLSNWNDANILSISGENSKNYGMVNAYDITNKIFIKITKNEFDKFKNIKYIGCQSKSIIRN